jgi:hypothetical protein
VAHLIEGEGAEGEPFRALRRGGFSIPPAAAAAAQVSVPVSSVDGQTGAVSLAGTYATPADLTARLNRSTDVHAADTAYTTYMARGEALFAQETTPTVNGAIAWQYE